MPSFAKDLAHPEQNNLSVRELSLIVDWLRGDYYRARRQSPVLPHDEDAAEQAVRWPARSPIPGPTSSAPRPAAGNRPPKSRAPLRRQLRRAAMATSPKRKRGYSRPSTLHCAKSHRFGSRDWLTGLLDPDQIKSDRYFGQTRHVKGEMVGFVNDNLKELDDADKAKLQNVIVALSAEAALPVTSRSRQKGRRRRHASQRPQSPGRSLRKLVVRRLPQIPRSGRSGQRARPHGLGLERLARPLHHRPDA